MYDEDRTDAGWHGPGRYPKRDYEHDYDVSGGGLDGGGRDTTTYGRTSPGEPLVSDRPYQERYRPYDEGSPVRMRRVEYSREVRVVPRAKGGTVSKIGFIFGLLSSVMGLVFVGSFLLDVALLQMGIVFMMGCWLGSLGSLFSITGIILGIVGLALGAGMNKSKAVFGLIFSVLYWVMMGMYFLLVMFIITSSP
ncbi:MAG: hypothetical protein ACMUHM_02625 [Thermoplasmatota archaeon]